MLRAIAVVVISYITRNVGAMWVCAVFLLDFPVADAVRVRGSMDHGTCGVTAPAAVDIWMV